VEGNLFLLRYIEVGIATSCADPNDVYPLSFGCGNGAYSVIAFALLRGSNGRQNAYMFANVFFYADRCSIQSWFLYCFPKHI